MPPLGKAAIIIVLLIAIAGVIYVKQQSGKDPGTTKAQQQETVTPADFPAPVENAEPAAPTPDKPAAVTPTPTVTDEKPQKPAPVKPVPQASKPVAAKPAGLPRLLELGADKCIPCKMMQPVLAELRQEYPGKLQVDFIDVWKDPAAGEKYGVQVIPTQVFFAADGKELFRHTGFYPKEDILAKFAEFGVLL